MLEKVIVPDIGISSTREIVIETPSWNRTILPNKCKTRVWTSPNLVDRGHDPARSQSFESRAIFESLYLFLPIFFSIGRNNEIPDGLAMRHSVCNWVSGLLTGLMSNICRQYRANERGKIDRFAFHRPFYHFAIQQLAEKMLFGN